MSNDIKTIRVYDPSTDQYEVRVCTTGGLVQTLRYQGSDSYSSLLAQQQQAAAMSQIGSGIGCDSMPTESKKEPQKQTKKETPMGTLKRYIEEHRNVIMPLILALLVDHFVLKGAVRHKVQAVIEALLAKLQKSLEVANDK